MCLIWQILKQMHGGLAVATCLHLSGSTIHVLASYLTFAVRAILVRNKPNSEDTADLQMGGFTVKGQHWAMTCG